MCAHNGCKLIILGELRDHLRCPRGVFIHKQNCAAVERLSSEPFGFEDYGPLSPELENQPR